MTMPRLVKGKSFYNKPWYASYHSMMDRCYREKSANYSYYGGRGIRVCGEWHNIENFEKWALSSGYAPGLWLDRVDVDGDYCPSNCKWATPMEQANNRRNTVYLTYCGETMSLSDWARAIGMNLSTVRNRYYRGLPVEKILNRGDLNVKGNRR